MTGVLAGFVDELCKLGVADSAAAGTGIKPPPKIHLPKPPVGVQPASAPKFGAPPGLKPPRLPRVSMMAAKLPSTKPRAPRAWTRPGAA
ncbi:MAG: hypothetical protein JRG90_12630 [Deltaproteobacteria bacterium]|nr:hypothetical protein [Deltaproteobacteria bacterium]